MPDVGIDPGADVDTGVPREAPRSVQGTVTDPTDFALEGAHVTTVPHGFEATTDADGEFVVDHLPAGEVRLVVTAPGYATLTTEPVDAEVSIALDPVDASPVVTVAVTGPDGLAVEGAIVSGTIGTAKTDAAGLATLRASQGLTDLSIADPGDRFWARTVVEIAVPATGGVQIAVNVSGRPSGAATEVGDAACLACHPSEKTATTSAHGAAFAPEPIEELSGFFDAGASVAIGAASATLGRAGTQATITLRAASGEERIFDVSGVLGDARSGSVPLTDVGGKSWVLPVGWVAADPFREPWPEAVARLVPWHAEAWFDDDGEFLTALMPPEESADTRCFPCHVSGFTLTPEKDGGVTLTALGGGGGRWDSDGVTCERCHGPGSDHVAAGDPWLVTNPKALDADRAADVCAACHASIEGVDAPLPYAYAATGSFQPGEVLADFAVSVATTWSSGAADAPGEQSDELSASPHGPGSLLPLQCFDCHDPHDEAGIDASLRLDFHDNALCLGCHLSLSYGGDVATMKDHNEHLIAYDPVGSEIGRCTGCHMPRTAARVSVGELSGAGDLPSHLFAALSPQWTLDVFDAAKADVLPLGEFPAHACIECHAYQAWREEQTPGGVMLGATGDPTLRATHEAFLAQFVDRFP